jgi:hypothetical protein
MTASAGIDTSVYRPNMLAALKADPNNNAVWCGFYHDAPSHSNSGWPGHRADVIALGFNPVPIYVGQQVQGPGSHIVTAAQGTIDGDDCAAKMLAEGFPARSCCFLDLESPDGAFMPYVDAWVTAMEKRGWTSGVYVSHLMAAVIATVHPNTRIWAYKVASVAGSSGSAPFSTEDPSGSGYAGAVIWQHEDEVTISGPGYSFTVDLDTSTVADPAAPLAAQPVSAQVPSPAPPLASPVSSIPLGTGGVAQPSAAPPPSPWPMPPIPLTPSVPQLAPAFTPAAVAATGPTLSTVATPARVGATVALTGLLTGATAMSTSHIASVKDLIDLAFIYLVAPVVLGIVVGLATSLAKLLNINMQGALAQRVLTATENGAMALVSKAETAADDHSTITTKNQMIAGTLNYINAAVPDAVKSLGLATPAGQGILANLAEAKVQAAIATVAPKVAP